MAEQNKCLQCQFLKEFHDYEYLRYHCRIHKWGLKEFDPETNKTIYEVIKNCDGEDD